MIEPKPTNAFHALRAILYYAGFYSVTIIYSVLCLLVALPLSYRNRYKVITQVNFFYMIWMRLCCGLKTKIVGRENLPKEGAFVLVSNHQSEWETLFLLTLVRPQCTVLKKELLSIPFFGWGLAMLKPIAIDRSQRRGALKSLLKDGKARLEDDIPVVIFPQGTRVPVGKMGKFNKGGAMLALSADVPVVPMVHNAGLYWPGKSFAKHPGEVEVRIGEPIATAGRSVDEVHAEMVEWLEVQMKELKVID